MYKWWTRVRFVFKLRKFIPFLRDYFTDKNIKSSRKVIPVVAVLAYFLLPFDIIPDFLSVFGILDDFTVLTLVLQQLVKIAPDELKDKHDMLE